MVSVIVSIEEKWGEELAGGLGVKGYRVFRVRSLLEVVEYLYKYKIDIVVTGQSIDGIYIHKLLPVLFMFFKDVKVIVHLNEYSPLLERAFRIAGVTCVISNTNAGESVSVLIDNLTAKEKAFAVI